MYYNISMKEHAICLPILLLALALYIVFAILEVPNRVRVLQLQGDWFDGSTPALTIIGETIFMHKLNSILAYKTRKNEIEVYADNETQVIKYSIQNNKLYLYDRHTTESTILHKSKLGEVK